MALKNNLGRLRDRMRFYTFLLRNFNKKKFTCPICDYCGPLEDIHFPTGLRKHAQCPKCKALERHRLQYLVVNKYLNERNSLVQKMIHFAPEPFFKKVFSKHFGQYETADLNMSGVDHKVDLLELPFDDQSYDFVFASHVLEHIPNDRQAISEIRRILKPSGVAMLPVPLVCEKTIEYSEPNPLENHHVRAPGFDYFDRYDRYFSKVDKITSNSFLGKFQLFCYEDRSGWPTKECPLRPSTQGEKHLDIVPVCYA